jgi:hypothetical protein
LTFVSRAFASVTNVGKAPRKASAFVENVDGTALLGAGGKGVIAMIFSPYNMFFNFDTANRVGSEVDDDVKVFIKTIDIS